MPKDSLYRRYLEAQLQRDRAAAFRVLLDDGLAAGVSVPELYLGVIQPAQYEIGRLWQANLLSVAEEHVATSISQLALSYLYPYIPRSAPNGKRVLVACVHEERHDLGARMAADFYEMGGFSVRYLGAGIKADQLVAMVREDRPDILGLSVTMTANLDALHLMVDRARDAVGDGMRLAVGGAAHHRGSELSSAIEAEVVDIDVRTAVDHSAQLLTQGVR